MNTRDLQEIEIDLIDPNPENPRIFFRQEELDSLLQSIYKHGLQVPIAVYRDRKRFILIDGERRLRTCKKLNFKKIPAIIHEKPDQLQNILLMFNIHALREQWDYFTIANKLPKIIELFEKKNKHTPNESELSLETGLSRGTIRRCNLLINLPPRFKKIILEELKKPKSQQVFTADFFLEMEQALKTVRRNFPQFENQIEEIRNNLVEKYKDKIFNNITDLRLIQKIATSPKNVNYPIESAERALDLVFQKNNVDIEDVYNETFAVLYDERKILGYADTLKYHLEYLRNDEKDEQLKEKLRELKTLIEHILEEE